MNTHDFVGSVEKVPKWVLKQYAARRAEDAEDARRAEKKARKERKRRERGRRASTSSHAGLRSCRGTQVPLTGTG